MSRNDACTATRKKIEEYSYLLSNGIGKGYSSLVYRGRNDNTDEEVAIKVIEMKMLKGEVHKNLLASEIEVLKGLKHAEHVINMFDVYNTKNNTYIVTELCDGGDLGKLIQKQKTIPENQAVSYMKQIIIGYTHMHSHSIIHRDLKPANIFLRNGQIKIADFGFAMKSSDGKKHCSYNVGSPIYMPPEALNDSLYSFKSDIWALGVIFYEMLTGKTPWKAKTEKELGRMLSSVPIKKLLPKNLNQSSVDFLIRTLDINIQSRMCPDQLVRFVFSDSQGYSQSCLRRGSSISRNDFQQNSLTRNSINTPKNPLFNLTKRNDENKNASLPKTAATINSGKEHPMLSTNNITGVNSTDKKLISKQLLSQVHLCRFLYKLLSRINEKINGNISTVLKDYMSGLIFQKLDQVKNLTLLDEKKAREYRDSQDYQKISQIISQYQSKYEKQMTKPQVGVEFSLDFDRIQSELANQILKMYTQINFTPEVEQVKEQIIVLDYLVTLRQLISLLKNNDLEGFHTKSKMEAIVEGAPSKTITKEHVKAISAKLRAIKLL